MFMLLRLLLHLLSCLLEIIRSAGYSFLIEMEHCGKCCRQKWKLIDLDGCVCCKMYRCAEILYYHVCCIKLFVECVFSSLNRSISSIISHLEAHRIPMVAFIVLPHTSLHSLTLFFIAWSMQFV